MAETLAAAAIYAGIASEVATVAAAGTTAAAAASTAALSTISFGSVMSTLGMVGSLVTGVGSIIGGNQQASIAKQNSQNEAAQIRLEQAAAEKDASERALDNVKQLRQTIARNNAYYSAAGADISSGTPASVQDANMEEAERQLRIDRESTELTKAGLQSRAAGVLSSGKSTAASYRSSGYWKAAGSLLESGTRYMNRGS